MNQWSENLKTKKELELIADLLKNRKNYAELGATIPRGLVITGPEGCGKTYAAHCLMEDCGLPVFDIREKEKEGLSSSIRSAFTQAAASETPSVLFIDDLDKINDGKEAPFSLEEEELINCMIETAIYPEMFVLATATSLDTISNYLLRTRRLDWVIPLHNSEGMNCDAVNFRGI